MANEMLLEPANSADANPVNFHDQLVEATPVAFVTPVIVALNVLVFLGMLVKGVPFLQPSAHAVLPWGANFGPLTSSGQWWRLLAACFLHFGIIHIAVNMYVLLQVGTFTERLFGNLRFALLYLIAGVGGNIAGLYFHPFAVGAGASGAIFGVYGALLAFLLVQRGVVPRQYASGIAKSAGLFVVYNLFAGFVRPETDQVAHIGGILCGFLAGCVLARPLGSRRAHHRVGLAAAVALGATGLGFAAVRHLPARSPEQTRWYLELLTAPNVTVGHNDRVVYSGSTTREDAQRMAQAMTESGIFQPAEVAVVLHRDPSGATLSIPLNANPSAAPQPARVSDGKAGQPAAPSALHVLPWDDPQVLNNFRRMGPQLANLAGGPPLTIRLTNSDGELKNQVRINTGDAIIGSRDHLIYALPYTPAQAHTIGALLQSSDIFRDTGVAALLSRTASASELVLVPTRAGWSEAITASTVQALAQQLAPLTGAPLNLHLLDTSGHAQFEAHAQ